MKNVKLVVPNKNDYAYKEKLENDIKTMSYNAGYNVSYDGYNYETGCISFNKEKWLKLINDNNVYFAYIKDCNINMYIGYVNYYLNKESNIYESSILIEYKYRGKGYAKDALNLLIKEAYKNGIDYLYDSFEKDRNNTLKLFLDTGFEIVKETKWKKFGKDVEGVVVKVALEDK